MTKTTIRTLLGVAAVAAVALSFVMQPAERAVATGLGGATGVNGTSLDGIADPVPQAALPAPDRR